MQQTTQSAPMPKINRGKVSYPQTSTDESPKRYIKVSGDAVSAFMNSQQWSECIACARVHGHYCDPNTWMIPEDLYNLIMMMTTTNKTDKS